MAVNKNFVVKNGLEVNQELILADANTDRVGIGTSTPQYKFHVNGGIGATFANVTGILTANTGIVTNLQGTNLNFNGISTISNLYGETAEYNTFYGDVGIVTFVNTTGISTVETRFNVGIAGTVLTAFVNAGVGSIGIGTEFPIYQLDIRSPVSTGVTSLYLQGDAVFTGDLTLDDILGDQSTFNFLNVTGFSTVSDIFVTGIGSITSNVGLVTNISGTNLNYGGIGTISTLYGSSVEYDNIYGDVGIVTTLSGTEINYSGVGTIATLYGTNIEYNNIYGDVGIVTTLSGSNINYSGVGTIATLYGSSAEYDNIYSDVGIVTTLRGTNLSYSGVGTITTLYGTNIEYDNIYGDVGIVTTLRGTNLNYSGISTLGVVTSGNIFSSGIVTATSFVGSGSNLSGIVTSLVAGTNVSISSSTGQITISATGGGTGESYWVASPSGISTTSNVGIGSTNPSSTLSVQGTLFVSGVSTIGNFRITPVGTGASVGGIGITYYGDGSQLQGVAAGFFISTDISNQVEYIPYATSFGSTTGFGATSLLVYNPSTSRFGVGTTNPTNTLTVGGATSTRDLFTTGVSTFVGVSSFTQGFQILTTTQNLNLTPTQTSGTVTIGGTQQSGTFTVNPSTTNSDTTISSGSNTTGTTKRINLGTGGLSGSFTQITVGPSAGIGTVFVESGTNIGIGTSRATSDLHVVGDTLVTGIVTATGGFNIGIQSSGVNIATGVVTAINFIGAGNTLSYSSATRTVNLTISSQPSDGSDFNTGITSIRSARLTATGSEVLVLPSTSGVEYIIYSILASNVAVGNTDVNVIGAFDFNGGERSYFAYNIPIPTGTAVELLRRPQILNPSDKVTMRATDASRIGIATGVDVYISYQAKVTTNYFGVGFGTVGIASTNPTVVYTSTGAPSVIQSIRLANRTDTGDYPVSVTVTSGVNTTFLVDDLIIPKYASVEILDNPKAITTNDVISIIVDQLQTIDVQVSGIRVT